MLDFLTQTCSIVGKHDFETKYIENKKKSINFYIAAKLKFLPKKRFYIIFLNKPTSTWTLDFVI